jgi:hypothetical protein
MSILSNMKSEGLEGQEDRLGGFSRKTTGLYPGKVKVAYLTKSPKGASALNLTFEINGQEYREPPVYFTNSKGENFYFTKDANGNRTDKKAQLPGFFLVNSLCRLATGQELFELADTVEEKTLKLYDPDEKKEVPKSVEVITGLTGAEVLLAIVEQTVNKSEKNDQTGEYEPIADSRDENVIEHYFHLDTRASINEMDKALEAEKEGKAIPEFLFATQWEERYGGKKRDKRTIKDGDASAPKSGRPGSAGGAPAASGKAATSSLFNKNK